MTNAELITKLKTDIMRLIPPYETMDEVIAYKEAIDDVMLVLDTLEEPVCEDLNKAAYKKVREMFGNDMVDYGGHSQVDASKAAKIFIAGANWQKAQDDKMVDIIYQQGIEKGKDEMRETLKRKEKK